MKNLIHSLVLKKINWGIIGCGNYTENSFIPTFLKLKTAKLVSVYSKNIERAKNISQKFSIPNYFNDLEKFFASNVDVVYISSRNDEHYNHILAALQHNKIVVCEKPIVLTSNQANEIYKIQQEKKLPIFVNLPYLYHPLITKAKELIANNYIGKIISINIDYLTNYPPNNNYRYTKKYGGGPVYDLAPHLLSLVRYLAGDFVLLNSYVSNLIYKQEIEDFASIQLKLEDDGFVNLNIGFCAKKPINSIKIIGYEGNIVIDGLIHNRAGKAKMLIQKEGHLKILFTKKNNNLLLELREIQRVLLKRKQYNAFTFETSVKDIKIIEDVLKNAKTI